MMILTHTIDDIEAIIIRPKSLPKPLFWLLCFCAALPGELLLRYITMRGDVASSLSVEEGCALVMFDCYDCLVTFLLAERAGAWRVVCSPITGEGRWQVRLITRVRVG